MLSSKTNALLTHTLASFWRKQSCQIILWKIPGFSSPLDRKFVNDNWFIIRKTRNVQLNCLWLLQTSLEAKINNTFWKITYHKGDRLHENSRESNQDGGQEVLSFDAHQLLFSCITYLSLPELVYAERINNQPTSRYVLLYFHRFYTDTGGVIDPRPLCIHSSFWVTGLDLLMWGCLHFDGSTDCVWMWLMDVLFLKCCLLIVKDAISWLTVQRIALFSCLQLTSVIFQNSGSPGGCTCCSDLRLQFFKVS